MTIEWQILLKKVRPLLSIYNTTPAVRDAIREWEQNATIGRTYVIWKIREDIIDNLRPILMNILKTTKREDGTKMDETMITRTTNTFINKHFKLKSAQTSKYDITIYNVLNRLPNWSVTGRSPSTSEFRRIE